MCVASIHGIHRPCHELCCRPVHFCRGGSSGSHTDDFSEGREGGGRTPSGRNMFRFSGSSAGSASSPTSPDGGRPKPPGGVLPMLGRRASAVLGKYPVPHLDLTGDLGPSPEQ